SRRSPHACRERSTGSRRRGVGRSNRISGTWRRSSAPRSADALGASRAAGYPGRFFGAAYFMAQSTCEEIIPDASLVHVAIILDGNGRWAARRGLPRAAGHRAGAEAVRRIVAAAPDLGVGTLTLFAFSSDNWRRPAAEVRGLFRLLGRYLMREARECIRRGVRLSFPGRRDRLPPSL